MEHNMVQSTVQQKCGSESWSLLFKINRQTFPTRTQAAQNQSCAQNIKLIINSLQQKSFTSKSTMSKRTIVQLHKERALSTKRKLSS